MASSVTRYVAGPAPARVGTPSSAPDLVVGLASLPQTGEARQTRGWPPAPKLDSLVENAPVPMSDPANRITELRLATLDRQDDETIVVLGQYLRYAFTNHCDVLYAFGEPLSISAVDIIGKFSARMTVIASAMGDFRDIQHDFIDERTGTAPLFGMLMSPYGNRLFDWGDAYSVSQFEPSLKHEMPGVRASLDLRISPDGLSLKLHSTSITLDTWTAAHPQIRLYHLLSGASIEESRTSVLYEVLDSHHAELQSALSNLRRSNDPLDYLDQFALAFENARLSPREKALADDVLATLGSEGATTSWDVLVLPGIVRTPESIKYQSLESVLAILQTSISTARALGADETAQELEDMWLETSAEMHGLFDVPELQKRLEDRPGPEATSKGEHLIFIGQLGSFSNERLERALERQARLITVLNQMIDVDVALSYRVFTWQTRAGHLAPAVQVVCSVTGCSELQASALRSSLGELVHAAFVGLYGLTFSLGADPNADPWDEKRYKARILPREDESAITSPPFPDWAFTVDFMCSMERPTALEMTLTRGPKLVTPEVTDGPSPSEDNGPNLETMLRRVSRRMGTLGQTAGLSIVASSNDPLPESFLQMLCTEVGGSVPWGYAEGDIEDIPPTNLPLIDALRVFHPPFGSWYGGDLDRPSLRLWSPVEEFPLGGIPLGMATTQHAKANVEIEVRLPDQDRLRHVYVIGKTGSGKTNLLRGLVTNELASPSVGLAVIDPHGDLAAHVLNLLPRSRLSDLQVIDLSDPDLTPVLNPLLLTGDSALSRSRLAQEILGVLKLRIFHEFSGPRFDEIVRLLLDTLLDEGYPVTPSLVDASLLLTDEKIQKTVREGLRDPELKSRWAFHDKLKNGREYYDLLDWVVSKFDDISHDETLRAVLGGSSNTVDVDSVVRRNGILVVSIPEGMVGRDTAEFVGALVLLQLKAALFRRVPRKSEPFFVYVDEFQKFAGAGFEDLLAEARKFGVGLVMAHQNMEQLRSFSQRTGMSTNALINSILGNVGTMVVFPIGSQDANTLSDQLELKATDIARIARFEAVVRMTLDGHQLRTFTLRSRYTEPGLDPRRVDEIREFLANAGLMARRGDVSSVIDERRRVLRGVQREKSADVSAGEKKEVSQGSGSSFLDEWLAKRREVEEAPEVRRGSVRADRSLSSRDVGQVDGASASGLATTANGILGGDVWGKLIGPVMRLSDVATYLNKSTARLSAEAGRGRLLVLTTKEGTKVVPASHFKEGALVAGLERVLKAMSGAPFSEWTNAAWLSTPSPAIGGESPLQYLRKGGDAELLVAAATAYSEVH